jgi:soluble cytochrome b562
MKRFLPCILLLVALNGCSKSSELHDAMESMKEPYKAMRETDDINQVKTELATFVQGLNIAKTQQIKPEDQGTFDEGMKKLVELTGQVEAAVAAGNLDQAKALLEQMGDVRKEYHDKLGVK